MQNGRAAIRGKRMGKNLKMKALREAEEARRAEKEAIVDEWFAKFDYNANQQLERDELRELLTYLKPDAPPTEEALDFLIEKATRIEAFSCAFPGNPNGAVGWHATRKTVVRYEAYVRDRQFLDDIFETFDVNKNGTLDATEILPLLVRVAPSASPTQDDADHIMEELDLNRDGELDRDEVLPKIANWRLLKHETDKDRERRLKKMKHLVEAEVALQAAGRQLLRKSEKKSRPNSSTSTVCLVM